MNFGKQLEIHALAAFSRVPGELELIRSAFTDESELRFSAAAFDYTAALRITDKRLLLEDHHIFAEIDSLAASVVENILRGCAPLRPGYPTKD